MFFRTAKLSSPYNHCELFENKIHIFCVLYCRRRYHKPWLNTASPFFNIKYLEYIGAHASSPFFHQEPSSLKLLHGMRRENWWQEDVFRLLWIFFTYWTYRADIIAYSWNVFKSKIQEDVAAALCSTLSIRYRAFLSKWPTKL